MASGLLLLRPDGGGPRRAEALRPVRWAGLAGDGRCFESSAFRPPPRRPCSPERPMAAGGLLLALGLLTPLAGLCISVVMLNAIGSVHWKNGFWASKGGYEFNLALLAGAVAIVATGPGRLSLDRLIGWDDEISGLWWAIGVFAAAMILSVLTLATRHVEPADAQANERGASRVSPPVPRVMLGSRPRPRSSRQSRDPPQSHRTTPAGKHGFPRG